MGGTGQQEDWQSWNGNQAYCFPGASSPKELGHPLQVRGAPAGWEPPPPSPTQGKSCSQGSHTSSFKA